MLRTVRFVDEAKPRYSPALCNDLRREGVGTQMQVRNLVRPCEQRPADLPACRITMRVQNPRAAVRGLSRKRQFRSCPVEFRSPLDELCDVLRPFFDQQRYGLRATQAVSGIQRVLFVEPDFIFIGKSYGNSSLGPSRCPPRRNRRDGFWGSSSWK